MLPDVEPFAAEVAATMTAALGPVMERLAAAEARLGMLGDLRDRVVTVEAKSTGVVLETPINLTPILERLATIEARIDILGDLRDRVVSIEAKSAQPLLAPDLGDVRDRLVLLETRMPTKELWDELSTARLKSLEFDRQREDATQKELGAVRERLAVLETRAPVAGPPGKDGLNGKDGAPGKDGEPGKDGLAGLSFEGVYQEGHTYDKGNLVTWAGSSWHCNETTTTKPGDGSKDWTLMVKRGRDGKDGRDAQTTPVVSVGRPS